MEDTDGNMDVEEHIQDKLEEHPKRRSTVQSLPSDYSDVQPKSYDPAFISDISNKMQVPDTISVKGAGDYEKSGSQPIWDDPPQRHEMKVPDRIMVAGGGQHIGARHELPPLDFDRFRLSKQSDFVGLATPPRILTIEEQFPNVDEAEDDEEEDEQTRRVPNGTIAVQTPQTPGPSMSDSLVLYDEDQAQLRTQLVKLSRRVAVMEKEQQAVANRTMLMYSAAVGYFMLKFVWWMFKNK